MGRVAIRITYKNKPYACNLHSSPTHYGSECAPAMNYDFKFYTLIALYGAVFICVNVWVIPFFSRVPIFIHSLSLNAHFCHSTRKNYASFLPNAIYLGANINRFSVFFWEHLFYLHMFNDKYFMSESSMCMRERERKLN